MLEILGASTAQKVCVVLIGVIRTLLLEELLLKLLLLCVEDMSRVEVVVPWSAVE